MGKEKTKMFRFEKDIVISDGPLALLKIITSGQRNVHMSIIRATERHPGYPL